MKSEIIKERINEIYAIYEQTGIMPNTQCKKKFSNGTLIGPWLHNYKKEIENIA